MSFYFFYIVSSADCPYSTPAGQTCARWVRRWRWWAAASPVSRRSLGRWRCGSRAAAATGGAWATRGGKSRKKTLMNDVGKVQSSITHVIWFGNVYHVSTAATDSPLLLPPLQDDVLHGVQAGVQGGFAPGLQVLPRVESGGRGARLPAPWVLSTSAHPHAASPKHCRESCIYLALCFLPPAKKH